MGFGKSQEQEGGYSGSTERKNKVHFASLMDTRHLKKTRSWNHSYSSMKAEWCSGRDIVKDDSGAYTVFSEQGLSVSQMSAAKIMDVIARLPVCDGQAADAVSAYTQVKLEGCSKLLRIPISECPDVWIPLPRHKWPKS